MQVAKWGNSLAVRLPAKLVEQLGLKEGDEVELRPTAAGIFEVARQLTPDELFERVRLMNKKLPADYKFDRDVANSRGSDDVE